MQLFHYGICSNFNKEEIQKLKYINIVNGSVRLNILVTDDLEYS